MKKLFLSVVIFLCLVGSMIAYQGIKFLSTPASASNEAVIFEVSPGTSFGVIAAELEAQGVVTSAQKLKILARFDHSAQKVRVGEYSIAKNLTPKQVLSILVSGKSIERPITIQEGFNVFEIADQLEKRGFTTHQEFLRLVRDPVLVKELLGEPRPSLEGYLFPETYYVTKYTKPEEFVRMMVARFQTVYKALPPHTFSRHELVTLASIVEKETGAPEERPLISSVFHNRLTQRMRLQTDPTVIYGKYILTGSWDKNISRNDLLTDQPYNTYLKYGLPPGPIANPGKDALIAAAQPSTSKYLFFVSRNDGTHVFTENFGAHQSAVNKFQLNRKAREGKSWRDLKKRQGH